MAKTLFEMGSRKAQGCSSTTRNAAPSRMVDGPLLVIAGAGTGKTRVINERIRHRSNPTIPCSAKTFWALTYTKKAIAN